MILTATIHVAEMQHVLRCEKRGVTSKRSYDERTHPLILGTSYAYEIASLTT